MSTSLLVFFALLYIKTTAGLEYGGLGLDFSYSILVAETMGKVNCGALPMAVAVQVNISSFPIL